MKNTFSLMVIGLVFISTISAQDGTFDDQVPRTKMRPADHIVVSLFTDVWSGLPENMDTYIINRGIAFDYLQELPLGTSNFSIAAGLGLSSHNLYSNHTYEWNEENNAFNFTPIFDETDYNNNKISLNYINIPLEFRFRTRNLPKTFRIHAGIKGGYLINAHTKYYGDNAQGREIKIKQKSLDNIEPFLLGLNGRIGYGRVNISAFMSLTPLFRENNAEDAELISLGLTAILF
jgi:hypothetical protein